MIMITPEQIGTMRKIPTTRIEYIVVEPSHVTPQSIRVTEWYRDGRYLEYEIDSAGGRVNG